MNEIIIFSEAIKIWKWKMLNGANDLMKNDMLNSDSQKTKSFIIASEMLKLLDIRIEVKSSK